jgi:hypothetical protein
MKCETAEGGETLNFNYVSNSEMGDRREDHFTVRLVFFVIILLRSESATWVVGCRLVRLRRTVSGHRVL